jgi:hypothetical protein
MSKAKMCEGAGTPVLSYWWIPILTALCVTSAWLSKTAQDTQKWYPVIWMYVIQCVCIWPIVARYSKNLIFDGLLYDSIIVFSFLLTFIALDCGENFSVLNWVGVGLVATGLIVIKC